MKDEAKDSCQTCRYFYRERFMGKGVCQRFPPQRSPIIIYGFAFFTADKQPESKPTGWCGEYQSN